MTLLHLQIVSTPFQIHVGPEDLDLCFLPTKRRQLKCS